MDWLIRVFQTMRMMSKCSVIHDTDIIKQKHGMTVNGFCQAYGDSEGNLHERCINCKAAPHQYGEVRYQYHVERCFI